MASWSLKRPPRRKAAFPSLRLRVNYCSPYNMSEPTHAVEQAATRGGLPVSPSLGPTLESAHLGSHPPLMDRRVAIISVLSVLLAGAAAVIARVLVTLIAFITNLSFYGRFSTQAVRAGRSSIGAFLRSLCRSSGLRLIVGFMGAIRISRDPRSWDSRGDGTGADAPEPHSTAADVSQATLSSHCHRNRRPVRGGRTNHRNRRARSDRSSASCLRRRPRSGRHCSRRELRPEWRRHSEVRCRRRCWQLSCCWIRDSAAIVRAGGTGEHDGGGIAVPV